MQHKCNNHKSIHSLHNIAELKMFQRMNATVEITKKTAILSYICFLEHLRENEEEQKKIKVNKLFLFLQTYFTYFNSSI